MRPIAALLCALVLCGCAPLVTQSPGGALSPVNAIADGEERHLMLSGYDVVSYFTDGGPRKGDPAFRSNYQGVDFRFTSAEHKRLFDAAPGKYVPQFGGYCTNGIVYAVPWGGNVDEWEMIDGKLYMFGGRGSHQAFKLDPVGNMALANKYWAEEVKGSNAFWQRTKRVVFHVPHWKTSAELAEMVAQAKREGRLPN